MKKLITLLLVVVLSQAVFAKVHKVETGIDVLKANNFAQLKGKRVGLITNPTGVDKNLKSTIDILNEAKDVQLVALFAPEHGVRGDVHAGDKIETYTDPKTGIVVYSLYGKTRRPTSEMLKGLDAIIYDIQDIGSRSYTFISTMGVVMEEAAKNNIEFIVLDRPNPLGGEKVEGNLVEDGFFSFVSQFKIPYVYGLTPGELAVMLNNEGMINGKCKLTVIPMKGWKRSMSFDQTGLPWIAPSPHIPHPISAYYYPTTGILGELGVVSIGVGYTLPFQLVATDSISANQLADSLNALNLSGVYFRPIFIKPFYSVGKGENYQGVQIHITEPDKVILSDIQFWIMQEMHKQNPKIDFFKKCDPSRIRMWNIVSGSDYLIKEFGKDYDFRKVYSYWHKDDALFKEKSKKYYLYK